MFSINTYKFFLEKFKISFLFTYNTNRRNNFLDLIFCMANRRRVDKTFVLTEKEILERAKEKVNSVLNTEFKVIAKNESQKELIRSIKNNEITICTGKAGTGKTFVSLAFALGLLKAQNNPFNKIYLVKSVTALRGEEVGYLKGPQPIYEKVLTPNGWVEMGDILVGDTVIGDDGKPTKVLSIKEYDEEDIYRLTLRDGRYVDSALSHIWNVKTKKLDYFSVTTDYILKNYKSDNLYLPFNDIVEYNEKETIMSPYLLGVILGDGCLSSNHVRFCSVDDEIVSKIQNEITEKNLNLTKNNITYTISSNRKASPKGSREILIENIKTNEKTYGSVGEISEKMNVSPTTIIRRCNRNTVIDDHKYSFTGKILGSGNIYKNELDKLNLLGLRSYEKFIPEQYKYNSIENRIELLRGLLDTDGTIKKNGEITYVTTSKILAEDIKELVLSLGGLGRIYFYEVKNRNQTLNGKKIIQRKPIYTVYIKFKNNNFNPFFLKRKAERFKTLTYDNANKIINVEKLNRKEKIKCISIDNKSKLYLTKDFIPTHNSLQEKIEPFMWSFLINMEKLIDDSVINQLMEGDLIRPFPLAYARGTTLDNCIIIADEMQNVSLRNARTLLTRIGKNSKMILLGDSNQIDLKNEHESSLEPLLQMFSDVEKIGCITMAEKDTNVRNPLINVIEDRFKLYYEENPIQTNGNGRKNGNGNGR